MRVSKATQRAVGRFDLLVRSDLSVPCSNTHLAVIFNARFEWLRAQLLLKRNVERLDLLKLFQRHPGNADVGSELASVRNDLAESPDLPDEDAVWTGFEPTQAGREAPAGYRAHYACLRRLNELADEHGLTIGPFGYYVSRHR